jgi:glyceraldehyde 3-phosphate dehydrogenase
MARVAINGLGRIGRATLKIVMDTPTLSLVAANELAAIKDVEYLLKHDTVYGRYEKPVAAADGKLVVDGKRVALFQERDPASLQWRSLDVDVVFECTGVFTRREDLVKHVEAGAKYVILSAPSKGDDVETVVHGVNIPDHASAIISCASCTTNCITPVMEILGRRIGVRKAIMTTVHAYTASQHIVDGPHRHPRRGRAGAANFVPTTTGAATATTKALPTYRGRFDGIAIRGPVPVGSLADIVVLTSRPTSVAEVNQVFREEASSDRYREVVGVTEEPAVSSDIIKDTRASVIDLGMTQVVDGDLVKVLSWYDNEWGYASQMVREATRIAMTMRQADKEPTQTTHA